MAKPTNINDFMQQTGASFEDTVELLYGVVGSNNDTRDWNAIMASSDPLTAARAATGEMYSNAASTLVPNRDTTIVPNPTNQTSIIKYTSTADGKPKEVYGIVAGDGTLLRGGFLNQETAVKQATNFGVKDANIIQSGNSFVEKAEDTVRSKRPTIKEIRDRTGLSFQEAGALLGNLISAERNTKLDPTKPAVRVDYGAIMGSQDPVAAARAATRQIRESASTAAYKLDPSRIVDRVDNFVLYKETTGEVPELQVRYAPNDSYTQGFGGFSVINAPGQDPNKRLQELGVGITQDQIKRLETAYNNYAAANPTYSPRAGVTVNIPYNNVFSTLTPVAENPYYTDQSFVSFGNIPEGYDLTAARQIPTQAPQDIEPDYFAQKRTPTAQQQTATPQPVGQQPFAPPIPVAPAPTVQPTFNMGTSYLPAFAGQQPTQQGQQVPSSSTTYGTLPFTYTPTTPFTVGQTATQAQQPMTVGQPSEVRTYRNNSGLTVSITFVNGQPVTPIPSGFFPADQMQSQTSVPSTMQMTATNTPQMAIGGMMPSTQNIVSGFKPNAMQRIASSLGYTGDIANFNNFLAGNPAANQKYNSYMQAAQQMANGGYVRKYQEGGDVQKDPRVLSQQYIPQQNFPAGATLPQVQATIAKTPGLPMGATVVPVGTAVEAGQLVSPTSGQVSGQVALPTAQAATTAAAMPQAAPAAKVSTIESTGAVSATVDALQAAQGTLDPRAQVLAAQQTASSVGNVQAAQGNAILMTNPVQRQIQDGELIAPAANAETAAKFTEQIEAAEATPSKQATVQGQLEQLMTQFEGGKTPAWAAASMRNAMATLSARGLGASSLAGQAVIQAAMEAALPIAQLDAQTQASFEAQNLSNRQQRAMLAAQQRAAFLGQEFDQTFQSRVANAAKISDVANMNFTAEQQVALENSRIANTMELQNLSNRQAVVLAEAAALANMDMANLNNRQQAAVMNAQNFLAVDMQNLSNQQQTDLFKAQSRIQALFTDQAAQNASQQFNASSENQVNQFFSSLAAQVGQFNATQANAQAQFNAGQINTIERFNAEINNQRDQFNAQNRLIIDQSNAQWRREISTAATAAVNRANEINAASLVGLSQSAYNNLWQYYRDNMEWAWTSAENERQRVMNLAVAQLQADASKDIQSMKQDYESSASFGSLIGKMLTSDLTGSILGGIFG